MGTKNVWREALTPEFSHPEAKVVWALRVALAGLALYALTVDPRYTTRPLLFASAVAGLLASFLFAFIPTRRPRTVKAAEAVTLLAFLAHVVGHAFGLYAGFFWYDKVLHLIQSLAAALVLFALSQATYWVWDWTRVRPFEVAVYLFCMVVTLGAFWEIAEFTMDAVFGTEEQNGNLDTMVDLLADVTGALTGALLAAWATRYGQEHGLDEVSERPKRDVPRRAPQ